MRLIGWLCSEEFPIGSCVARPISIIGSGRGKLIHLHPNGTEEFTSRPRGKACATHCNDVRHMFSRVIEYWYASSQMYSEVINSIPNIVTS